MAPELTRGEGRRHEKTMFSIQSAVSGAGFGELAFCWPFNPETGSSGLAVGVTTLVEDVVIVTV